MLRLPEEQGSMTKQDKLNEFILMNLQDGSTQLTNMDIQFPLIKLYALIIKAY